MTENTDGPSENTDREIWRERPGDFYADSIHVTTGGGIGISCGGTVYVKPVRAWHRLAAGVAVSGWQPIETAPKDGTTILLGAIEQTYKGKIVAAIVTAGSWPSDEECRIRIGDCGGDCHCSEYEYAEPNWITWHGGFTTENPATHWMPLPPPPVCSGRPE